MPSLHAWHPHPSAPLPLRDWLLTPGSLTRRLAGRSAAFNVLRLRQTAARAFNDEEGLVGLRPGQRGLVREVFLRDGDTPLVYAHSVTALAGMRGPWRTLSKLGSRPLGEALFVDPLIRRTPLRFRHIDAHHPLYRRLAGHLGGLPPRLWARRSLFYRDARPLLVTEVFLPALVS